MSNDNEDILDESEWAISVYGWCLKHGIEDHEENRCVLIRGKPSSKMLKYISRSSFFPATLVPNEEESWLPKEGFTTQMLYVGVCAPILAIFDDTYNRVPAQARQAKAATVQNSTEITGTYEGKLLRVVTPITESTNKSTVFYALVSPVEGLCKAYRIAQADCFYFNEYREQKLRFTEARTKAWNDAIKANVASSWDAGMGSSFSVNHVNAVHTVLENFYDISKPLDEGYAREIASADHVWGVVDVTAAKLQDLHRWLWRSGLEVDSKCYQSFIALSMNEMDRNPTVWKEDVEAALQHNLLLAQAMAQAMAG